MAMTARDPFRGDPETTPERPSSFREQLYRDRKLKSRRQMDRHIADRVAERSEANGDTTTTPPPQPTYLPGLARLFRGGVAGDVRAIIVVVVMVLGAFFFGRWVGQQSPPDVAPQTAPVVAEA